MKKNLLRTLTIVLCVLFGLNAQAYDFENNGIYYTIVDGEQLTVKVTAQKTFAATATYTGDMQIPATVDNEETTYKVTEIDQLAFYSCNTLTSVTLSDNIEKIGSMGFYLCKTLETVKFGKNVKEIGSTAFSSCYALNNIEMNEGLTTIQSKAFNGCTAITDIVIPNSVETIAANAFQGCNHISKLTLGSGLKSIGDGAFYSTSMLTEVHANMATPFAIEETVFSDKTYANATLYVPAGCAETYSTTDSWSNFTNIKEEESSAIALNSNNANIKVSANNGAINVYGAEGANVAVYSTNGSCLYSGCSNHISLNASGLYLVRVNGKSFKVIL